MIDKKPVQATEVVKCMSCGITFKSASKFLRRCNSCKRKKTSARASGKINSSAKGNSYLKED